jgi:hypothetical protein
MMAVTNGRERTQSEYQTLLKESGWAIGGVYRSGYEVVVEGIKH